MSAVLLLSDSLPLTCDTSSNRRIQKSKTDFYAEVLRRGDRLAHGAEYRKVDAKVELVCKSGHLFSITPADYKAGKGCAKCAKTGFNPAQPAILYYVEFFPHPTRSVFKIGITNSTVKRRYSDLKTPRQVVWEKRFSDGAEAARWEATIKRLFSRHRCKDCPVDGLGNTELFDRNILPLCPDFRFLDPARSMARQVLAELDLLLEAQESAIVS